MLTTEDRYEIIWNSISILNTLFYNRTECFMKIVSGIRDIIYCFAYLYFKHIIIYKYKKKK